MTGVVLGVAVIALYLWAVRRYDERFPDRAFSRGRILAFLAGTACMIAAVLPPVDRLADGSFTMHMVQHLVLMLVGPPLVLLGAPLLLIVAVPPAPVARRLTAFASSPTGYALFAPLTGWLAFVAVLWVAHFSPLYDAALSHPAVHVFEHALFVAAAFLFWGAVVQVGYAPRPLSFPARMLFLFLAIPQGSFLGLAIYAARGVMYPHYLAGRTVAQAVTDQQQGGEAMWILGGLLFFIAFMLTAAAWAANERGAEATA